MSKLLSYERCVMDMSNETARGHYKRGQRLGPDEVLVARPSRWGNPYRIRHYPRLGASDGRVHAVLLPGGNELGFKSELQAHLFAVMGYRTRVLPGLIEKYPAEFEALRGKRLLCYCDEELPCHVDAIIARLEEERSE